MKPEVKSSAELAAMVASAEATEKALAPTIKRILSVVSAMVKVHGQFQQTLFDPIRMAENLAQAKLFFMHIEAAVRTSFAVKLAGGEENWKALTDGQRDELTPALREIDGLGSWEVVKGRLLAGFNVKARIGKEDVSVGALNNKDPRYAGQDGAKNWLRDADKLRTDAIDKHNEELKALAESKSAEANRDNGKQETAAEGTATRHKADPIDFNLPDVIQMRVNQFIRTLHEAIKVKSKENAVYHKAIADRIGVCTQEISNYCEAEKKAYADFLRPKPPTQAQATQMLETRRTAGTQVSELPDVSSQLSDNAADDNALGQIPDPTEADLDLADVEAIDELDRVLAGELVDLSETEKEEDVATA